MSCDYADGALHGYFDHEVDAFGALEFERHLEWCAECVEEIEVLKSLRTSMSRAQLYARMPGSLREKILEGRTARPAYSFPARMHWRWLATAAAFLLFAFAGWREAAIRRGENYERALSAEVVDVHLRSLQPGHLIDIASSDQHTVKPWFDGKLEFSPPVRDFVDEGFALEGGRLDVLRGRTIAVLVYSRRKNPLNVLIWSTDEKDAAPRAGTRQGHQWLDWRTGGMEFCIVSDAAPADLEALQRLLAQ